MASPPADWPAIPGFFLFIWKQGGWVGVDLFFVLSGFLVSGLLFDEYANRGEVSVGRFYIRRGGKIYPAFFVLITATVVVAILRGRDVWNSRLVAELLFIQSYIDGIWGITWSLAVEEHFYLMLPLVLCLILKLNANATEPLRPVLMLVVCVAVASVAMRVINWRLRPAYAHMTHLYASHLRLDSLFFGVAIAYAYNFHKTWFVESFSRWRNWLIASGILMLLPAFAYPLESTPFIYTIGLTVFYLGAGAILIGTLLSTTVAGPFVKAVASLGAYSYSIYLWHSAVNAYGATIVQKFLGVSLGFELRTAVYFVGSFAFGIMMAKIVEMPALRLRNAIFPSRINADVSHEHGRPESAVTPN